VTALKAAAEPTRLRLLALCADTELAMSELAQILGQSQPRVSRHLKILADAHLIERSRDGVYALFRLKRDGSLTQVVLDLIAHLPDDDPTIALDQQRLAELNARRRAAADAFFATAAPEWDALSRLHGLEEAVEEALLSLSHFDHPIAQLVDIGTGTGRMLALFADRVAKGLGVDASRAMLTVARANLEEAGINNMTLRQADMGLLPLSSGTADLAIMHRVLHYAERPDQAVAEAARILRPGGRLIIVDFAPHSEQRLLTDHAHRWPGFSDDRIHEWLRAARLEPQAPIALPGSTLTVKLWTGNRPNQNIRQAGAATQSVADTAQLLAPADP